MSQGLYPGTTLNLSFSCPYLLNSAITGLFQPLCFWVPGPKTLGFVHTRQALCQPSPTLPSCHLSPDSLQSLTPSTWSVASPGPRKTASCTLLSPLRPHTSMALVSRVKDTSPGRPHRVTPTGVSHMHQGFCSYLELPHRQGAQGTEKAG